MNDNGFKVQNLWEELETFKFDDLTWLKPHVQSALGMKSYMERAAYVKKLKGNVVDLQKEIKSLKANLELARRELVKAEGFAKRDLDDELGYGMP